MTANHPPRVSDPAVFRRVRVIPCNSPEETVQTLLAKLDGAWSRESPGILAQLMTEAGAWLRDQESTSLANAPAAMQDVVAGLVEEQDHVGRWLTESREVEPDPDGPGTPLTELYTLLSGWWDRHGLPVDERPTRDGLGAHLDAAGYPPQKAGKGRRSRGLRPTGRLDHPPLPYGPAALTGRAELPPSAPVPS